MSCSSSQASPHSLGADPPPGGARLPDLLRDQGRRPPHHHLVQGQQGGRPQAQTDGQPGRPVQ